MRNAVAAGSLPRHVIVARTQIMVAVAAGVVAGGVAALFGGGEFTPLVGWDTAMLVYLTWVWAEIWRLDAEQTARRAGYTNPTRTVTDVLLLTASVASLVSVGFVLADAGHSTGRGELLRVGLGVLSVVLSWSVVHTIFALRYARLYYIDGDGGVDFNQPGRPDYGDFAYLAFTLGMTFQVSDTQLQARQFRRAALCHALLSYLFGTGLLATTINLVASITSK